MRIISLKRSMDVLEQTSLLLEKSLQCCGETLEAVEQQSRRLGVEDQEYAIDHLKETHRRLMSEPSPELIDEARRLIRQELTRVSKALSQYQEDLHPRFRRAVNSLGEAVHSMTEHSAHYGKCLTQAADDIESLGSLRDMNAIHDGIRRNVRSLRGHLQEMIRQSHAMIERLEGEKIALEKRLEEAEKQALTDPLTGLANRRAAEKAILDRISRKEAFCLALLDLNRFKRINDLWGHSAGDQILRAFGRRLAQMSGPGELVGRWGGDEFVLVLTRKLADAHARTSQLEKALAGDYLIDHNGSPTTLELSVTTGVAEHRPGETLKSLLSRADEALYARKTAK